MTRRDLLTALPAAGAGFLLPSCTATPMAPSSLAPGATAGAGFVQRLPMSTIFKGTDKFAQLCALAQQKNWAALPLGYRTVSVGRALVGTSYVSYTLEIDDHIESPSVNLYGLDCWTFFEASLAFARMIRSKPAPWTPVDMLRFIEMERYRGGHCDGTYLSRLHHLEDLFADNERRGLGHNMTRALGGVPIQRNIREMQVAWRAYRYLRNNPSLRSGMATIEARVSRLPVTYIPRSRVASIEPQIADGDILAIVSSDNSGYTSHVGMALKQGSNCHFMHATSKRDKGRRCIIDNRISKYLYENNSHAGLIVFRPIV
jgi:Protein of unknown function (DUF1460)